MRKSGNFFNVNVRLAKAVVFLAVAGGIALYSPASSGAPSPLWAVQAPKQEQPVLSSAPVPADLPELKPSGTVKEDPLAWDNPAPSAAAAPLTPLVEAPKMPSAAVPAVEKMEMAKVTPLPEEAPAPSDKTGSLEKRVAALEAMVSSLRNKSADLESLEVTVGELQQKIADGKTGTAAPVSKKEKTAVRHRAQHQARHHAVPAPRWVLKAAKPGRAWVSEKGSHEIRVVSVGENLAGIGKIKAVAKDSAGLWVVNGAKGRISQ